MSWLRKTASVLISGRPVHETAYVPTPEADVPVPPPPQQAGAQQTQAPGQGRSGASRFLIGCLGVFLVLFLLVVGLAALGGGGGGGGSGRDEARGSGETFTRKNYGVLVANPEEHVGATVDITGQLLDNPEKQGNEVAFQMWADPVKVDWNTLVRTDESALGLGTDDYVHVRGTVLGSFEGENAFGGTVSAVEVEARGGGARGGR